MISSDFIRAKQVDFIDVKYASVALQLCNPQKGVAFGRRPNIVRARLTVN